MAEARIEVTVSFGHIASIPDIGSIAEDLGLLWSMLIGYRCYPVAAKIHSDSIDSHNDAGSLFISSSSSKEAQEVELNGGDVIWDLANPPQGGNEQLSTTISAWLAERDKLRVCATLLVESWSETLTGEAKLGALAQALEAFHRGNSSYKQSFVDGNDYSVIEAKLRSAIGECVPSSDLKAALLKRIEYGNQVSLRKRTRDLFRQMPALLRSHFDKGVVDWITDTRNKIIHREPGTPAPNYDHMGTVVGLLGLIIHVALLQKLDVPDGIISSRIQRLERYVEAMSRYNPLNVP